MLGRHLARGLDSCYTNTVDWLDEENLPGEIGDQEYDHEVAMGRQPTSIQKDPDPFVSLLSFVGKTVWKTIPDVEKSVRSRIQSIRENMNPAAIARYDSVERYEAHR